MAKQHRPFRLDPAVYNEPGTVAMITACTWGQRKFFMRADIANMTMSVVKETAAKHDTPVYAYCLMPDHTHLVVASTRRIGLVDFMSEVKAVSARRSWSLGVHRTIWQDSFRDDIVRVDNDAWGLTRYALDNPREAGLVERWSDYPYSGSTEFSAAQIEEIFSNPAFHRSGFGSAPFPRRE